MQKKPKVGLSVVLWLVGSIFAVAMVFVGAVVLAVLSMNDPDTVLKTGQDFLQFGLAIGFSAIGVAATVRAFRKSLKGEAASGLLLLVGRISPVLAIIGGVAGTVFAFQIQASHKEGIERSRNWGCERIVGEVRDAQFDRCLAVYADCMEKTKTSPCYSPSSASEANACEAEIATGEAKLKEAELALPNEVNSYEDKVQAFCVLSAIHAKK